MIYGFPVSYLRVSSVALNQTSFLNMPLPHHIIHSCLLHFHTVFHTQPDFCLEASTYQTISSSPFSSHPGCFFGSSSLLSEYISSFKDQMKNYLVHKIFISSASYPSWYNKKNCSLNVKNSVDVHWIKTEKF